MGDTFADDVRNNKKNVLLILCSGFLIAPLYPLNILRGATLYEWFFALCGIALCALCGMTAEIMPDIVVKNILENVALFHLKFTCLTSSILKSVTSYLETKTTFYEFFVYLCIMFATIFSAFLFERIRNNMTIKQMRRC